MGFSCSSTISQDEVIPVSTMVELLIDIHILEARVDKLRLPNDSSFAIYNTLEKEIFEEKKVDKNTYDQSYQFYLSQPKALDHIYAIVVDSLNVIQKRGYQEDTELTKGVERKFNIDSVSRNTDRIGARALTRDSLLRK